VTPFSQYVKNLALMNVMQMEKGKARWSMIADTIWDMILGKAGQLPGPVAPELVEMAKKQGREFETQDPQSYFPDKLDEFREEMKQNGWELGEDEEELFELAMHPEQYRAYKSGKAKADFEADLAERKAKKNAPKGDAQPQTITVTVNGQSYKVDIAYGDKPAAAPAASAAPAAAAAPVGEGLEVLAPLEGKAYMVSNSSETPKKVGDHVEEGDIICYIEAMKVFNRIKAEKAGTITSINFTSGDSVEEDDVLMTIA